MPVAPVPVRDGTLSAVCAAAAVVAPVPPCATVTGAASSAPLTIWAAVAFWVTVPPATIGATSVAATVVAAGNAEIFTSAMIAPYLTAMSCFIMK